MCARRTFARDAPVSDDRPVRHGNARGVGVVDGDADEPQVTIVRPTSFAIMRALPPEP